jgi:hypothetical protein
VGTLHSLLHSSFSWHSLRLWFFPVTQDDASRTVSLCEIRVEFHTIRHISATPPLPIKGELQVFTCLRAAESRKSRPHRMERVASLTEFLPETRHGAK